MTFGMKTHFRQVNGGSALFWPALELKHPTVVCAELSLTRTEQLEIGWLLHVHTAAKGAASSLARSSAAGPTAIWHLLCLNRALGLPSGGLPGTSP